MKRDRSLEADAGMRMTQDGTWVRIIAVDQVPAGRGCYVEVHGRALAVFRDDDGDGVTVLADACPHAGASLSGGTIADGCVICPRHGWMFDLRTGRCPDNPAVGAAFYPARVRDGYVEAALHAQPRSPASPQAAPSLREGADGRAI